MSARGTGRREASVQSSDASVPETAAWRDVENRLRAGESFLRSLIDGSGHSAYIFVKDLDGRYVLVNQASEDFFGMSRAQIEGRTSYELFPAAVAEQHRIQDSLVLAGDSEMTVEERLVSHSGEAITVLMKKFPLRDEHGRAYAIGCFSMDVSDRVRIEAELREQSRRLAEAQRIAHVGSFQWDIAANEVSWSDELFRIYGVEPNAFEANLEAFLARIHPEDREQVRQTVTQAVAEQNTFQSRERIVRPSGELRHLATWGEVIRDDDGTPLRLVGICQDITERHEQEEALRASEQRYRALVDQLEHRVAERTADLLEANAELESFAYSVAHDLRAPLRAMHGLSKALLEDYADQFDDIGRDYGGRIVSAAERMDTLIQDLLSYARLSRSEPRLVPVCLSDVVSDVLSQLDSEISERGARIDVKGPFPHVVAHEATLCQIVLNLLTNAMKFVAEGTRPQITVRAERCKQSVRLSVADNGIGIDPAHQQRIFHIFERLHGIEQYSGTGIGLAIVRKGVERLGGRVGVDSTPAVGSEFWIELAAATNDDV